MPVPKKEKNHCVPFSFQYGKEFQLKKRKGKKPMNREA